MYVTLILRRRRRSERSEKRKQQGITISSAGKEMRGGLYYKYKTK